MITHNSIIREVVLIDLERIDAVMRERAYENCHTQCGGFVFCRHCGKCIQRDFVNIFWYDLVVRN